MSWAEAPCWDESFSAVCLSVFQGWQLELQAHNRMIGNGLQAGLLTHVKQTTSVPSVIKWPKGSISDIYVEAILLQ